jgi:hypothetical protein
LTRNTAKLFGAHVAQQQHQVLLARDFLAHDAVEVAQQCRHLAKQFLQPRERNLAHFAVFERHRVALVAPGADRIHSQQFARHLEPGNLLLPGRVVLVRLEMTEAQRVQVAEWLGRRAGASCTHHATVRATDS